MVGVFQPTQFPLCHPLGPTEGIRHGQHGMEPAVCGQRPGLVCHTEHPVHPVRNLRVDVQQYGVVLTSLVALAVHASPPCSPPRAVLEGTAMNGRAQLTRARRRVDESPLIRLTRSAHTELRESWQRPGTGALERRATT